MARNAWQQRKHLHGNYISYTDFTRRPDSMQVQASKRMLNGNYISYTGFTRRPDSTQVQASKRMLNGNYKPHRFHVQAGQRVQASKRMLSGEMLHFTLRFQQ